MNSLWLLVIIALALVEIIGCWFVFEKAGKPGWHAIVPFLNTYDEFDIAWDKKHGLYMIGFCILDCLLGIISHVQNEMLEGLIVIVALVCCLEIIYLSIGLSIRLAKVFGKGNGFALGLIFLTPIFIMILGLGKAKYLEVKENREEQGNI